MMRRNIHGPVVVIEDDIEDQELFLEAYNNLGYKNKIHFFTDGGKALEYLNRTDVTPFLILSDINMPKLHGFELRTKILTDALLQQKYIPYLFFTTSSSQKSVEEAYRLSVQGFFVKKNSLAELEDTIKVIMEYWMQCVSPNSF